MRGSGGYCCGSRRLRYLIKDLLTMCGQFVEINTEIGESQSRRLFDCVFPDVHYIRTNTRA